MAQVHAISRNGRLVVVKKDFEDESREHFLKRCWWIAKRVCNEPKKDLQEVEIVSHIWSCVENHGVSYDEDVMKAIQ